MGQDPQHEASAKKEKKEEEEQHQDVHYSSEDYVVKWPYQLECESNRAKI